MAAFLADSLVPGTTTTNLTARAPEVGGAWINSAALFGGYSSGTLTLLANQAGVTGSASNGPWIGYYNNAAPPSPNYGVKANFQRTDSNSSSNLPGFLLRANPTTRNAYLVTTSINLTTLYKITAGAITSVATSATGVNFGLPTGVAFLPYEATIKDGTISVYRNDVLIISYNDPTPHTDAGFAGIVIRGSARINSLEANEVTAALVVGTPTAEGTTTADMAGGRTVAVSFSAIGTTQVAQLQSLQYRVGAFYAAEATCTAAFTSLPLITSQMYSLSQPPEPDFVGIFFIEEKSAILSSGGAVASFVGARRAAGAFNTSGIASSAIATRTFAQGESEFAVGSGGSASGTMAAVRIVATVIASSPNFGAGAFAMTGRAICAGTVSASGNAVADMAGHVSVKIAAAGSSTASFEPFDMVVAAEIGSSGGASAIFAPLAYATAVAASRSLSVVTFRGGRIAHGIIQSHGQAALSKWVADVIMTSGFSAQSVMASKMITLSFSDNIPTPDDRAVVLPIEDRVVSLVAEERTVLLAAEDRSIILPAENRIIYL